VAQPERFLPVPTIKRTTFIDDLTGKGGLYIKKLADVDQRVLQALAAKSVAATRARNRNAAGKA
jgi:hypothetical protein